MEHSFYIASTSYFCLLSLLTETRKLPRLYQYFSLSFLQIIPNKFMDHFGGKISRTIELESPDGNTYVVEVSKNLSKKSPCHGWEAFLDAHHIEENDSLLFRHIKNSRFEVLVLDSDDCEKVFSCVGIKVTCNVQERSSDYDDISNSSYADTTKSSGSKEFASCERVHSSHPRKTAKTPAKYSSSEDSGKILILCCISIIIRVMCSQYIYIRFTVVILPV